MTTTLMAKSKDDRFAFDALTLSGHSLRVEEAAQALHRVLSARMRETFGLTEEEHERLTRLSTLAGLLHDIGKATQSFQDMIAKLSGELHPWRHELLSAGAVQGETGLNAWLAEHLEEDELTLVAMMIAGHHLRARPDLASPRARRDEVLALDSADLEPVWARAAALLGTETRPVLTSRTLSHAEGTELLTDYQMAGDEWRRRSDKASPVLGLGKALVIAADIVGSAHAKRVSITQWIEEVLGGGLDEAALTRVVEHRLGGAQPRPFQEQVAASEDRVTVVTAGCGNGKTLAAYLWARRHAVGRRLAFCYPTTGTTTAGFADYLLAQSDLERRLLHSRASVDVEGFGRSPDDDEETPLELWAPDVLDRWGADVVACTTDTVLGLMQNWRSALASLPLWSSCAFVFDEIHSYDASLFGSLLAFLKLVRAPVLLMTASLSPARQAALAALLGRPVEPIQGDPTIERAPRYRLEPSSLEAALPEAVRTATEGGRVLWVSNTVARAQAAYRRLRDELGADRVRVYHSRFRYEDRVRRQTEVLEDFRSDRGCVVVATQVCEMSLDISADLLVTELPPFPSLVQRLGRLNRRDAVPSRTKRCLWFWPEGERPYRKDELEEAHALAVRLSERDLSQLDLAEALVEVNEQEYVVRGTPFFEQTWETYPTALRESMVGWTVIRAEDLPKAGKKTPRRVLLRKEIGMPPRGKGGVPPGWPRLRGRLVVPHGLVAYDEQEGASWAS